MSEDPWTGARPSGPDPVAIGVLILFVASVLLVTSVVVTLWLRGWI